MKQYYEKSSFDYIKYDEQSAANQSVLKQKCEDLEFDIKLLMDGLAKETAMIKLEECYMWIGKAIRDGQIERNLEFEQQNTGMKMGIGMTE
jgi:uncharacterized beta-barrel protein YwiB (DUF1934 family)